MPEIEGVSPAQLWNFLYVALILIAIGVLLLNAGEKWRAWQERRREHAAGHVENLSKSIAGELRSIDERLKNVETKVKKIDGYLDSDKRRIQGLEEGHRGIAEGFSTLAVAMLAMVEHELHNGNGEQLSKAKDDLISYLAKTRNGSYSGSGGGTDEE